MEKKTWIRYRFQTKSVDDYRPLIFNTEFPWWCSGQSDNSATIIAYLPATEDLTKYWDDAFDIESTQEAAIQFTGRFPRPKWFTGSEVLTSPTHP